MRSRSKKMLLGLSLPSALAMGLSAWFVAQAQGGSSPPPSTATQLAQISGDPDKPRRHFRERDVLELTPVQAAKVYKALRDSMMAGYAASGDSAAVEFGEWTRYNTAPYRSATHGLRYVNNYANETAQNYRLYEKAGKLPVGSIIAKDSFSVPIDGQRRQGPLFIMEKMESGFNYVSGDWRYTMIMPDGEIFGMTKGVNSERVHFCIGCHLAQEDKDHLFFVPRSYRVRQ